MTRSGEAYWNFTKFVEGTMKATIKIDIKACNECPFYDWKDNHSEGNWEGTATCLKGNFTIGHSSVLPIPKNCPLKKKNKAS